MRRLPLLALFGGIAIGAASAGPAAAQSYPTQPNLEGNMSALFFVFDPLTPVAHDVDVG